MENFSIQKNIYENYAAIGEDYESFSYLHYLTPSRHFLLLKRLKMFKGAKVLDIGCASGKLLSILSDKYGITGTGIDITPTSLSKLYGTTDVKLIVANAEQMPFDDEVFNFVVSFGAFEHLTEIRDAIAEVERVLKEGGKALIWLAVKDHKYSLDWLSMLINPVKHKETMENAGHNFDRMLTKNELRKAFKEAGLHVKKVICHDALFQPFYDFVIIPSISRLLRKLWAIFFNSTDKKVGTSSVRLSSHLSSRRTLHRLYKVMLYPAFIFVALDKLLSYFDIGASAYFILEKPYPEN